MGSPLLLLCKNGTEMIGIRLCEGLRFSDILRMVCDKWVRLNVDNVTLCYSVPGHQQKCRLKNEDDFSCMVELAIVYELKVVEANVSSSIVSSSMDYVDKCDYTAASGIDSVDMDEDDDVVHYRKDKVLMSAAWATTIRHVGQKFPGGVDEFRDALCKYSTEIGFEFDYEVNKSTMVQANCKLKHDPEINCTWSINATISTINSIFIIRKLDNKHLCVLTQKKEKNKRLSCKVVAGLFKDKLIEKPNLCANDVKREMRLDYGYGISYVKAWQAVNKANDLLYGDSKESYQQLQWYTDAAKSLNPGSHIVLEVNDVTRRFSRLFLAFDACIRGFNFCRPMLFIDGTHLKGRFRGTLLSATGKNGNQGLYPLAYAVVDAENRVNWLWFLEQLHVIVGESRQMTFVSDRHIGLVEALPIAFPGANHFFCYHHLKDNLRTKFSGAEFSSYKKARILYLFRQCAYAKTVPMFNENMETLKREGGECIRNFLVGLPPKQWSVAFCGGSRYGEMTSNAAESFNYWIKTSRSLPIKPMVDRIRIDLMEWFMERKKESVGWTGVLCKYWEKELQILAEKGRTWNLRSSGEKVYEVLCDPTHRVDLNGRSCTCFKWQLTGFPCVHAVACINRFPNLHIQDFTDPYFFASAYRSSYERAIHPIPTSCRPDFERPNMPHILPPKTKIEPGRPRKQRIRSRGEKATARLVTCGRCGTVGRHNKKTCKKEI